jgi:hypothetical protein
MRKALKNREAVLAPVTMPPQGRQCGSVRGVIGAAEAPFLRDVDDASVG